MQLSVIIVNWNTRDILRGCLASVYGETKDISFEVIVIDNGSSDGSSEMVQMEFSQVVLIQNLENKGFAAANNQGMKSAKGLYVLLLNSDTVVLDGAIQKTLQFAEKQPHAAVVGCRVLNPDRTLQPTCFMYPSLLNLILSSTYLYKLFPQNRFFGRERMTWWKRDDVREVDVVTGCFMLLRRKAIEQVGLMDERFFMYGEETDWCYRFHKAGWKLLFTPDAHIIHLGGSSSRKVRPEMIIQIRLSILHFIKKHRNYFVYLFSKFFIVLWLLLRIPYWAAADLLSPRADREAGITAKAYWRGAVTILFQ